jgi:integrase
MKEGDDDHEPLAPATIEVAYNWTASVFKAAVSNRDIPVSPCRDIKLPTVDKAKIVPISIETVTALADAMPDRYYALVVLGAGTGVRIAEALGVTSDRIDWPRQLLTVDRQLSRESRKTPLFAPVKDKKNRPRTIPLTDEVMAVLVHHVRTYGLGPEELLFTNESNEPIRHSTFGGIWARAARPLGIEKRDGFHQLRHHYASLLIQGGANRLEVQTMLGHASSETTEIYSHLFPDNTDRIRAAVERGLPTLRISNVVNEF